MLIYNYLYHFLLETIAYYHENRSDCFLLLLDASKVFDRVEYVIPNSTRSKNVSYCIEINYAYVCQPENSD